MPRFVRVATKSGPRFGVVDGASVVLLDGHPFGGHERTQEVLGLEGLRLLAPVIPTKIVAVGRNYAAHAEELGNSIPAQDGMAMLFLKPSSSVIGPGDPILLPTDMSSDVHHEAELAVVIGKILHRATPSQAEDAIFGFTCANDVTARDLQQTESQWLRAKGFDSFCPLGPAITTDLDTSDVQIRCIVDGEVRQDGTTKDLLRGIGELLSEISQVMTLIPSDVVLTGTPAGVGPLRPGQTVSVEIAGIGALVNPVVDRMAIVRE
jgi:2-keto-4-pentenoate hydratase/2-oxohepta-3-ene-1,7-dioic acid hydratase in catechol pathway